MEIRVLGPFAVVQDGCEIGLGGPRQRAVLALLVAARDVGLTLDQLVIGTYGPDAPSSVGRSVLTFVSRHRRALGRNIIERTGNRYVLTQASASVDASRFEALLKSARKDDPAEADVLRSALALWRGPAYSDTDSIALCDEATRLDDLRASAAQRYFELQLRAERHREVLAELQSIVHDLPEREGLRMLHVVALQRSGEAIRAQNAVREAVEYFRSDIGITPGAELMALSAELEMSSSTGPRTRTPAARRRVPARYTSFIGRSDELAAVAATVRQHRIVTVAGVGGIGKTSLAGEVCTELSVEMEVVFVPMPQSPASDLLDAVATALALRPTDPGDTSGAIARSIGREPVLLFFDGCDRVTNGLPDVIDDLLGRCPGLRILLTSREPLGTVSERVIDLGPLPIGPQSASTDLFVERSSPSVPQREAAPEPDDPQISKIVSRLSGHPLAIELAAAQRGRLGVDGIVERLDDQVELLAVRRSASPHHVSFVAAMDWTCATLDDALAAAFHRLAVFTSGEISSSGADAVLETADSEPVLAVLADLSLVSRPGPAGPWRILEPVRQYAETHLHASPQAARVRNLHRGWLLNECETVGWLSLHGRVTETIDKLTFVGDEIVALAQQSAEAGDVTTILKIAADVGSTWCRSRTAAQLIEPVLWAADQIPTPATGSAVAGLIGATYLAYIASPERVDSLRQQLGSATISDDDDHTMLRMSRLESALVDALDRWELGAEQSANRSLELAKESEAHRASLGQPVQLEWFSIAGCYVTLGQFDSAAAKTRELIDWAGDDYPVQRAWALELLATIATSQGDHDAALSACSEATRLLLAAGDIDNASEIEYVRAWVHAHRDDYSAANAALERSDQYAAAVGVMEHDPFRHILRAVIASGLADWTLFEAAALGFFEDVPTSSNDPEYGELLLGEPGPQVHFARLIAPTARWLMHRGHLLDAAALLAAAPGAFADSAYQCWSETGEERRIGELCAAISPGGALKNSASSLDAVFRSLRLVIGGARDQLTIDMLASTDSENVIVSSQASSEL